MQKIWIGKAIVGNVSNPRIFKDEAIQVLLRQKIWIVKAIVSFQTPENLKMKR